MNIGIVTVSDTCSEDPSKDKSGIKLLSLIQEAYPDCNPFRYVVPDEIEKIKEVIIGLSNRDCNIIFTTGGTGFAPRDVTPEATKQLITKETPGIDIAIMLEGLKSTNKAMLSRAKSGIFGKTLIINFSGSVKAVTEQFFAVKEVIPHAVDLIQNKTDNVKKDHEILQNMMQDKLNLDTKEKQLTSPSKVKINVANRDRHSPYKMISVDEAYAIIMSVCEQQSETELLNISDTLGRVLAEDIRSFDALPPFPSSIKDGYAVKASDGYGVRTVVDSVAAGDSPDQQELKSGQCMRISTGAPVPPGADAVVQVEDTKLLKKSEDAAKENEIEILVTPKEGQDIRPIGSDIEAHSIVMKKGIVLNAAEIGVLAAVGKSKVRVYKRQAVGVISTGNEIQDSDLPLSYGKIRDSNKVTILALLKQYGYNGLDMGLAKDEPNAVKSIFEKAFSKCDIVITTGGVSMGEYDVIKRVLEMDFNAKIHFGRVDMKPGKPTTFATCFYKGNIKTIFGLPGNPVSATVTCLLFVIPTLRHIENRKEIFYPKIQVEVDFEPKQDPERPEYQRVYLNFGETAVRAQTTGKQISSRLNSFVAADGLLIVPPSKSSNEKIIENNLNSEKPVTTNKQITNNTQKVETTNTFAPTLQATPLFQAPNFSQNNFATGFCSNNQSLTFGGSIFHNPNEKKGLFNFTEVKHDNIQKSNNDAKNFQFSKNSDEENNSFEEKRFNFIFPKKKYWCYILDKN